MSTTPAPKEVPATHVVPMPKDIHYVYSYEAFNTASWTVVLGSPMLLFFQNLHASAKILAFAACLAPVLNILQIPAAQFVEKVGYRRFVLRGWTTRSVVVLGMTIVAFLPTDSFSPTLLIGLMLALSFTYNTLRGISVCGFLPWFTHIVHESRRGEFLAKDQFAGAIAGIACLFISASLMRHPAWYSLGILFSISAACAFTSLIFLRRIPDVPVEKIISNPNPMPWREMLLYPPFLKYVRYNVIISAALGASSVFWVRYFRTFLDVSQSNVLYFSALSTTVLAIGLFLVGPLIDRAGNKPALTVSGLLFIAHFTGWACVAGGILPWNDFVFCFQAVTSGLGSALWNLANVRTVMGIVPQMGRPHFLAIYSVASNLTVGLVPLVWGAFMDHFGGWDIKWGFWEWNNFSLFYCTLALTIATGLFALRFVVEPVTMTWDVFMTELLVKTPGRAISRLVGRSRGPVTG